MTTKKTLVRRALSLLLTLLMVLSLVPVSVISVYAAEEPKLNDDGYYEIETYEDLCWYRDQVNADRIDINAILMNDIVVNENVLDDEGNLNDGTFLKWEGIGDKFNGPTLVGFYGIFDGNGKTISGIYTDLSNGSFIRQNYGVIKNLNIVDSYFGGASFCGSYNYGSIINCSSSATIYNKNVTFGGICQTNDGLVENCTFTGKIITTSDSWYVGGICGRNYSTILNCYSSADVSGNSRFGGISGPNNGTVENCCSTGNVTISSTSMGKECYGVADGTVINSYYINTSMDSGSSAIAVSQDQLESGEVAYLLQGTQTDEIWGQKIGTDTAPVLGGDKVYYGYTSCADDAAVYTNNANATDEKLDHIFDNNNGFCTVCGGFEPATDENEDGVYEIANAGQLYWFADKVNNDYENFGSANAILTADIVVNEGVMDETSTDARVWTPIGGIYNPYIGAFDGNNKTISGLYFNNNEATSVGLFAATDSDAEIKNIGVINSYFSGYSRVGGIVGFNAYSKVTNCYNSGYVVGNSEVGGVVGNNRGTVASCYNIGAVSGNTIRIGGVAGYNSNGTITNCYYLDTAYKGGINGRDVAGSAEAKTAEQFKSGEVAYLLQGEQSEDVWGQKIGTDTVPILGGDKVYYGYTSCADDATEVYTNNSNATADKHVANFINGFCTDCGVFEPATDENEDGVYEIANAGQLYWFAQYVNAGNTSVNAILTANIVVNEGVMDETSTDVRAWTPIADYYKDTTGYGGTFDGNGKYISGLYFNNTEVSLVGLFSHINKNGVVNNLGIINSYFAGYEVVGSIAGRSRGIITKCYNTGSVKGNLFIGGILGDNFMGIVSECYNMGNVVGGTNVGGVAGTSDGEIYNCYNAGSVSGNSAVRGVLGSNFGTIQNCYYLDSCGALDNNAISKTAEQFASGEVAYLLQGEQTEEIWGQKIGTDAYPVLGGEKVYMKTDAEGNAVYYNEAVEEKTDKLAGHTISLGDKIAVNYYMSLTEKTLNDANAKMVFTVPDTGSAYTVEMYVKDAVKKTMNNKEFYVFTCEVAAKEMTSIIEAKFVASEGEIEIEDYSVQKYAEVILSDTVKYAKEQELVKLMLNYGTQAQRYFNYNTDNLANNTKLMTEEEKAPKLYGFAGAPFILEGTETGVTYYGTALSLETELAFRHYFIIDESVDVESLAISCGDYPVVLKKNGSLYELIISDIPAHEMGANHIIATIGGITLDYTIYSYGARAMETGKTELINLVSALAHFANKASEYAIK